jgi:hypothetical protein
VVEKAAGRAPAPVEAPASNKIRSKNKSNPKRTKTKGAAIGQRLSFYTGRHLMVKFFNLMSA